jgi:hypothetical protein
MHGLALKHEWAAEHLHSGRTIGRILDIVFNGLTSLDFRCALKKDTEIPFERGVRFEPTLFRQDEMRYHRWSLLMLLLTKFGSRLHAAE